MTRNGFAAKKLVLAAGGVAVVAAAAALGLRESSAGGDPYAAGGKVRRLSGDHLKLDDGRVVEFAAVRLPYDDEPAAEKAREVLGRWIADEGVRLQFDEERQDGKGRLLAYVYANDTFINERLARDGLAFVKLRRGNRRHAEALLAAQKLAQGEARGIWEHIRPSTAGRILIDEPAAAFHRPQCEKAVQSATPLRAADGTAAAFDAGCAPCGKCKPCSGNL